MAMGMASLLLGYMIAMPYPTQPTITGELLTDNNKQCWQPSACSGSKTTFQDGVVLFYWSIYMRLYILAGVELYLLLHHRLRHISWHQPKRSQRFIHGNFEILRFGVHDRFFYTTLISVQFQAKSKKVHQGGRKDNKFWPQGETWHVDQTLAFVWHGACRWLIVCRIVVIETR